MLPADANDEEAVACAFLVELLRDREHGRVLTLAEYQARYPGFEAVIAREFATSEEADRGDGGANPARVVADRYLLGGEVGRGGMATVSRAFEERLQRHLALKQVRVGATAREQARFLEEARVTAQLHHPGIVPVHDLGVDERGRAWFTMDLVRGRTLGALIDEATADVGRWSRALDVLLRVCEAVAYAHSKGVVHRDLKPQNVMVGRFGEVYVMDWGLARVDRAGDAARAADDGDAADGAAAPDDSLVLTARSGQDTPEWTLVGDVVGTPAYMPPEQARGEPDTDGRVDVYAIGAMLYQLMTGRVPYVDEGASVSSREILARVVHGPPTPVRALRPEAPPELVAVCEKAMAREPDDRYHDLLALRDDLRAFVEGRVVQAYEHGAWAELRKWIGRNRMVATAALVAVLALGVGLGASLYQGARAQESADEANASFDDAVEAVRSLLTRVAREDLMSVPQAAEVRLDLFRRGAEFYDKLVARRADDVDLRLAAARAHYQLAQQQQDLGDRAAANTTIERVLELERSVLAARPGDRSLLREIAGSYNHIGLTALNVGDVAGAERAWSHGVAMLDELLERERDGTTLQFAGLLYGNLYLAAEKQRDFAVAADRLARSVSMHREALELEPELSREPLAAACVAQGYMLRREKDHEGARRALEEARDLRLAILEADPGNREAQDKYATALQNLSVTLFDLKDYEAADRVCAEALRLRREHVARFPKLPESWKDLASSLSNSSLFARTQGRLDDALSAATEAVRVVKRALEMDPQRADFVHSLWVAYRNRHNTARALRDAALVTANAVEMADSPQALKDGRRQLLAAQRVAAAVAMTENDGERRQRVDAAFELLGRADAAGVLTPEDMAYKGLAPLRSDPRFADLRARVQAAHGGGR